MQKQNPLLRIWGWGSGFRAWKERGYRLEADAIVCRKAASGRFSVMHRIWVYFLIKLCGVQEE